MSAHTSHAPERATRWLPGARLDRYELLSLVAEGGMGSIWAARLSSRFNVDKLFAIKTLRAEHAHDPQFRAMLLDEARLCARIHHPNVVQIVDVAEHDGLLYIVMEWVAGQSLRHIQRALKKTGARIPIGVALRVIADACSGLHAAHELRDSSGEPLNVIHRDVSPDNILINTLGFAKIIDFGIARARGRLAETTQGHVRGKFRYMAPEQATGEALDRRADVYAMGTVLYELLSGSPHVDADHDAAVLVKLLSRKVVSPLPTHVPRPIDRIVRRALSSNRAERYASALELRDALENAMLDCNLVTSTDDVAKLLGDLLQPQPITARRQKSEKPSPSETKPRRRFVRATVGVALAILAATGSAVAMRNAPRVGTSEAVRASFLVETPSAIRSVSRSPSTRVASTESDDASIRSEAREHPTAAVKQPRALPAPGTRGRPTTAPRANASAHPAPRCDPPYVVDSRGVRKYRPECL